MAIFNFQVATIMKERISVMEKSLKRQPDSKKDRASYCYLPHHLQKYLKYDFCTHTWSGNQVPCLVNNKYRREYQKVVGTQKPNTSAILDQLYSTKIIPNLAEDRSRKMGGSLTARQQLQTAFAISCNSCNTSKKSPRYRRIYNESTYIQLTETLTIIVLSPVLINIANFQAVLLCTSPECFCLIWISHGPEFVRIRAKQRQILNLDICYVPVDQASLQ